MKNIHIFSGDSSSIIASYFNKISKDNFELNLETDGFYPRSIAIFDSNFGNIETFDFDDELTNSLNNSDAVFNKINLSRNTGNTIFNHTKFCENQLSANSVWEENLDVIELTVRKNHHLKSWNTLLYLKTILRERNVHCLKLVEKSDINNYNPTESLKNCYNPFKCDSLNFSYDIEEILESVRHELELLDSNKIIYLINDVDSVYSNISKKIAEFLQDEAPRSYKPSIMLLSGSNGSSDLNFNLKKLWNFSISKCLLDHSKIYNDFWLISMNYINELINTEFSITKNPYILLALVLNQINEIIEYSRIQNSNSSNLIGNFLNHPFRNVAISKFPFKNQLENQPFFSQDSESIEVICRKSYLDICNSDYFGLNVVDKSEILSLFRGTNNFQEMQFIERTLSYIFSKSNNFLNCRELKLANENVRLSTIIHPITDINKCSSINCILKDALNCKCNSKMTNLIRKYFDLELDEINAVIEDILIWKDYSYI